MHSLFSFGASKEMSLANSGSAHRPEVLRRKTLANNSRALIAIAAASMPMSVFWLVGGAAVPFVLAALCLAAGMVTLSLHHSGRHDEAAAGQVFAIMAMGTVLAFVDPELGDAGLGIASMGPVLASLLGRRAVRRQSWLLLAGVLAACVAASIVGAPAIPLARDLYLPVAGVAFLAALGLVAYTANRIGAAYEVHDRAQVNAYQHLIEHVRDGVLRFSSEGDLLLVSHSSEKLFGCRRFEITTSNLAERLHVLDRPAYLTAFADANIGGKARVIEVRLRRDEPGATVPSFIWVEVSFAPVIDPQETNGRHEVVALFRDVTERKNHEAAMCEARRMAEETSEAKSRFLATIGHELRTPLNAVVGFSEMMTSGIGGDLSDTNREYAGLIHQSGKHLLEVVRMLLDMSRIEAGKMELQREPFQAAALVGPCLAMVDGVAKSRRVQIETDIGRNLPLLVGDERACRQILINLVSNAIKFSHEGGLVRVSLKRQGQMLNLSVSDLGVGMAPESLERIGEPFFQVQDGLSRRYDGTGLGLSIVKGLIELHGGTLRAISEIGAGTTMTVLLPINGPAINSEDTAVVTQLRKEPAAEPTIPWPEEKRKAQ
jgi:cell cycle sensor histidine kinase DivJ